MLTGKELPPQHFVIIMVLKLHTEIFMPSEDADIASGLVMIMKHRE